MPIQLKGSPVSGKHVALDFNGGNITGDAGVLLLSEIEGQTGLIDSLAGCIEDSRRSYSVAHSINDLFAQRIYQIACGYEDANDSNSLRKDPALKMALDRLPVQEEDLASQPTISSLENQITEKELEKMKAVFVDQFISSYDEEPEVIVLDFDDTNHIRYMDNNKSLYSMVIMENTVLCLCMSMKESAENLLRQYYDRGNVPVEKKPWVTSKLLLKESAAIGQTPLLLLTGAVAIIFSTANTFLMVSSTNLARDVYQRFINPDISEKGIIRFQRIMIVLLAVVAYIVSSFFTSILDMALYAYTMVGAAVTPALLAAFLWKRVTVAGGVASIAAGMIVTLIYGVLNSTGLSNLSYDYIIYPAAGASIFFLIVVSLLTPHSPEEKWKPFMESGE